MDLEEIKSTSKNAFKKLVKKKMKEFSLDYLTTIKENHPKMDDLIYPALRLQNYLKDKNISVEAAKIYSSGEQEQQCSR